MTTASIRPSDGGSKRPEEGRPKVDFSFL
jgi:hypothetical protein